MVSAILAVKCGPSLAALTCGTLGAYIAFTFSVTHVRARVVVCSAVTVVVWWGEGNELVHHDEPGVLCMSQVVSCLRCVMPCCVVVCSHGVLSVLC